MITVYHQKHPKEVDPESKERQWDPMFDKKKPPPWPEMYVAVARVNTMDPEEAWMKTNHIESNWCSNSSVEVLSAPQYRSSSQYRSSMVGDIFDTGGELFVADVIGFKSLKGSRKCRLTGTSKT